MANQVFANGLEIACKAAAGLSPAAFPDPCFSPYLIPYPNTTFAKDLANASTTVFITNKPIALKDKSFFATSTGNEPATNNYAKGLKTQVITGKAYFRSWSMDVFVEGYNVCRHTDDMTHNHGSDPGNTGNWQYLDTPDAKAACKDDRERIEDECGVSKKDNDRFKKRQEKSSDRKKKKGATSSKSSKPRNMTWKDKHCTGVMIKPTNIDELEGRLSELKEEATGMIADMEGVLKDHAIEAGKDYAIRAGAKHIGALGCTVFTPAGTAACELGVGAYNIVDGVWTAGSTALELYGMRFEAGTLVDQARTSKKYMSKLAEYESQLSRATTQAEKDKLKSDFWESFRADMKEFVSDNECLKARKCMLVPYNSSQKGGKHGKEASSNVAKTSSAGKTNADDLFGKLGNASTGGCCPGQTGHHLLPEAWLSDSKCGYSKSVHNKAPTVCAEGVGHSDGTHGTFHTKTDEVSKKHLGEQVSIKRAIELAQQGHQNAVNTDFGERWYGEHCSPKCIEAQLQAFYKDFKCEPTVKDKVGGEGATSDTSTKGGGF